MLPERYRELLTAFVDGELSSRQRRHVVRLLRRSPEARALLHNLQADANVLRQLPPPPPAQDVAPAVLRTIVERRLQPGAPRPALTVTPFPAWAGVATAAAVLLGIAVGSYLYFSASLPRDEGPALADKHPNPPPPVPTPDGTRGPRDQVARGNAKPLPHAIHAAVPRPSRLPRAQMVRVRPRPPRPRPDDLPTPPNDNPLVGDRLGDPMLRVEKADVTIPVILPLIDTERKDRQRELAGELRKASAFHVELPCLDATRSLEWVRNALQAQNVRLLVDPVARGRVRTPQLKTDFALYVEDVTPDELMRLLQHLAEAHRGGIAKRPPDARFHGRVIVTRMNAQDHKELSALMGVDPTQSHAPRDSGKASDIQPRSVTGPITAKIQPGTASKVTAVPSSTGKAKPKPQGRVALVLALGPVRARHDAPEIKQFLARRKTARPGTLQVLLVLRGVS